MKTTNRNKRLFKKKHITRKNRKYGGNISLEIIPLPSTTFEKNSISNLEQTHIGTLAFAEQFSKQYLKQVHMYDNKLNSINPVESKLAVDFENELNNCYKILLQVDFFKASAVRRIAFYKYLDGLLPETTISKYFPELFKIGSDLSQIKNFFRIVKEIPKGSTHHEHNYSLGYTNAFIEYLLIQLPEEFEVVYIHNISSIKENPHMLWAQDKSIRLVTKSFIESISTELFNKCFLLVTTAECSTKITVISFQNNILTTRIDELETNSKGQNIVSVHSLDQAIHIIPETEHLYKNKEWAYLEFCASRFWQLTAHEKLVPIYWKYIAEKAKEENIQDVQIKFNMMLWKYLPDNSYADIYEKDTMDIIVPVIDNIKKETNISIHFIYGLPRMPYSKDEEKERNISTRLITKFRKINDIQNNMKLESNLIVGYDIFGEEDKTNKTEIFYENLYTFWNENKENVAYMIHSGETNKVKYPIDPNLLLAVVLPGSLRIGHGLSLWKYPFLMNKYANHIAVELCPISNSILGYISDIRNHPGIAYINNNVDISINTDNRGLLNYEYVSYDWFDLITALCLPYLVIVNIAKSSIRYASKIEIINTEILNRWKNSHALFLKNLK